MAVVNHAQGDQIHVQLTNKEMGAWYNVMWINMSCNEYEWRESTHRGLKAQSSKASLHSAASVRKSVRQRSWPCLLSAAAYCCTRIIREIVHLSCHAEPQGGETLTQVFTVPLGFARAVPPEASA